MTVFYEVDLFACSFFLAKMLPDMCSFLGQTSPRGLKTCMRELSPDSVSNNEL